MEQLWAEGRDRYVATGLDYAEAERLATTEHLGFEEDDAWFPLVAAWLERPPSSGGSLDESEEPGPRERRRLATTHEILRGALDMDEKSIAKQHEMRIGKILAKLGWPRAQRRINGVSMWVYLRPSDAWHALDRGAV